ncbi:MULTISPECIES: D-2-hydroxyacid dehydrogenase [Campylobacter]|uniref:2-hydroxyacid dehydrogenase n=1 Tax=Campylobacter porcelli TaxID=1660073 RepID=A0A1X9SY66_9BACT|nr:MULTISPECIES: D-2-hydroxyacid dehydrogenase [unclassified Campylobacter]ARR01224.1 2-hydroxyacid dehydrogenase [Campylobacter sp. RM6137]MCR8696046.1 D-2-hydroxyacid dehydrogenase [Campylobacter sp. RM19073]MEE3776397.1 D-2-hydroxyacid dehydrogenase [Campylobacter sp. CX2-4080-23]
MKIVCLDANTLGNDVDLKSIFGKFGEFISYDMTDENQTIDRLQGADIVLTNKVLITKDVIAKTNLKLICVTATGVNNIDLEAAKNANIVVKNVAGYSTNSVVQQTFANILAIRNSTSYYENYGKSSDGWAKSPIFVNLDRPIFELSNKKFCVVGLGTIGLEVAKVAQAFGCEVCYYSTSNNNSNPNFKRVSFEEVLKCDIISIHAPLNENTKNLFNAKALDELKDGAMLVNSGRGGIVDEEKIANLIDERKIYFITDVLEKEPIRANHPLLKVKNKDRLMITPHIAWASVEARKKLIELSAKNIEDFLKG